MAGRIGYAPAVMGADESVGTERMPDRSGPSAALRGLAWVLAVVSVLLAGMSLLAFAIGAVAPGICVALMAVASAGWAMPILVPRLAGTTVSPDRSRRTKRRFLGRVAVMGVVAFTFVEVDPIWHHDKWPGRLEADRLPDACEVFRPTAAALFPGLEPRRSRARITGAVHDAGCEWGSGALSVDYTLFQYDLGLDGGIEQASERYREGPGGPVPDAEGAMPLSGLGDEAVLSVSTGQADPAKVVQIQVSARKANVVARIVYMPLAGRDGKGAAVATARSSARDALSGIVLR
jgi:hypothetical protein